LQKTVGTPNGHLALFRVIAIVQPDANESSEAAESAPAVFMSAISGIAPPATLQPASHAIQGFRTNRL